MNTLNRIVVSALAASALVVFPSMAVLAEEMDHSHIHGNQHQSETMPEGKVGEEVMHHEMHSNSTQNAAQEEKAVMPDHGHHGEHDMTTNQEQHTGHNMATNPEAIGSPILLQPLTQSPPSGKAREAGYDGRYAMENTSIDLPILAQCALASRGLVMLDKVSRNMCAGKSSDTAREMPEPTPSGMHDHHQM